MKKKIVSLFLILTVALTMCIGSSGFAFAGDQMNRVNMQVKVDEGEAVTIKAYNASYKYNTYISLRDLCSVLTGTEKQMNLQKDEESGDYIITTGQPYIQAGGENEPFDEMTPDSIGMTTPYFIIDGSKQEYSVYETENDVYMKLLDLGLVFGLTVDLQNRDLLTVDTKQPFRIDINHLDDNGYFSFLHGALLGNADTGEILYGCKEDVKTQIASTSKLMTYLLVQEAIESGKLSLDSKVKLSEAVIEEANSEDSTSVFRNNFKLGQEVSVHDLLAGMLLPSANECATALAEAVSGSEEKFVVKMNNRAKKLGLTTAVFYNPHGLPDYDKHAVTAKRQNSMSAEDMFKLVTYLLENYEDELTYFTSKTSIDIPTVGEGAKANCTYSTLIYNLGVTGLKTGTTNRSGACIVTVIPVKNGGKTQNLVSVLFGAENNMERYEKSTMMLKYGQQFYAEKNAVTGTVLKASAVATAKGIKVSWKRTGSKVDGYQVYRAAKKGGKYTKIVTSHKLSALNKSVKKGKTYYYKVRGYKDIDGKTVYTKWSNVITKKAK